MTSPALKQQEVALATSLSAQSRAKRELWLVILALTALYVTVVAIGNRRYVWFDELLTFDIARSASLHQLWDRLVRFDCNPPASYILSRISMTIFGPTPVGLRFPSMAEFYFGSMAILLYVRRKAGLLFAAVAVLMLWAVAPTLYYAVEARPYALLFLSFACLLLSWDTAITTQPRRGALLGIFIATLALVGAHVFAPFTLLAFLVAEAVRFRRRRRPDYPLWAALLLPMLAMFLYIPLIRLYGGIVYLNPASYNTMAIFFENTIGDSVLIFVLLAALLVPVPKRADVQKPQFLAAEEVALFAYLFLTPVLLNVVLMHRGGMFYNRYALSSQVAILTALTIFLAHRVRMNRFAAYAASAVLILAILKGQVWHPLRYPAPQKTGFLTSVQPNLPIVVGEGQVFMEMNHRENQALLARLYFLKDQQASLQYAHTNFFQDFEAPDVLQQAGFPFTANVEPYARFVNAHKQFLLLTSPNKWVFLKLLASGASIAVVGDYSGEMPYADTTLYSVTMPPN